MLSTGSGILPSVNKEAPMSYRKVIVELVVHEDDTECAIQQLTADLERFQEQTTVYSAVIRDEQTGTPENAKEIAA
jgi:hypothetical protein